MEKATLQREDSLLPGHVSGGGCRSPLAPRAPFLKMRHPQRNKKVSMAVLVSVL